MRFSDRVVLVTGASGNLGRAVVAAFAAEGAQLVLLGREAPDTAGLPASTQALGLDLLDEAAVMEAAANAEARFGRIDVLCNLAGAFAMGEPVHETPDATFDLMIDANLRSLLHMVRAVVPGMLARERGCIVNVGASAARQGLARMGAYCVAKDAVIRLTESMAAELRTRGINVNCVLPTIIDTPANRAGMPNADPSRWVSPEALADVILFLASPAARAVHGAAIPVSGLS